MHPVTRNLRVASRAAVNKRVSAPTSRAAGGMLGA
jgi:hypothetical protein